MVQIMDGNLVVHAHPKHHYRTIFNKRTGFFARKEDTGFDEPFWSEDGPELLDVAITNYCEHGCEFCYRQSNRNGKHLSIDEMKVIVEQAKNAGVLQIALGGGNPNQHPHFIEILKLIRENGIVPSYTSNSESLTDEILYATKQYCGAMAISLYQPYNEIERITSRIKSFGIKLNVHIILKIDTIEMLTGWFVNPPAWFKNINAVIVLNYKPVASSKALMVTDKEQLRKFYSAVSNCSAVKVGFDSCCVPGIVTWMNVNPSLIESCEAARFSAFISEEAKMYPCSFMANTNDYGDLRRNTLVDIWQNNQAFINHRNKILNNGCENCQMQSICNGGCVFLNDINNCRAK